MPAERFVLDASVAVDWYDAVYFELARRLRVPIASIDEGIRTACDSFGVELL
jgi:predicted nucleic acid-binding protein